MLTAFLFNNKMMKYGTHVMGISSSPTPPVPVLPANTVRVRTSDGNPPQHDASTYETATLVEGTNDIYDVYKSGTSFTKLLYHCYNVIEVLGANTTNITYMSQMFLECDALTSVPLFDTSNVTNMSEMFAACRSLTSIPLFDTSSATNMNYMFYECLNVQSGALALYQQTSTQTNPPSKHNNTFYNCGSNTVTGAAELAQIPSSWGGTGA